jgi:hypothetical protein
VMHSSKTWLDHQRIDFSIHNALKFGNKQLHVSKNFPGGCIPQLPVNMGKEAVVEEEW